MFPITKSNWDNSLFKVRMYTKLMENYNEIPGMATSFESQTPVAGPNPSGYISSVCSCLNCMETPVVIADRSDGALIKFSLDQYGEAGFIPTCLEMKGEKAALGLGSDEYCYLFAIEGKKVWYSIETVPGSGIFSEKFYFQTAHSDLENYTPIKIITRNFGKRLCLCVIYSENTSPKNSVIYCNLDFRTDDTLLDLKSAVYPSDYENFDFAFIQNQVHFISFFNNQITVWNFEGSGSNYYALDKNAQLLAMRWTKWQGDKGRIVTLIKKETGYAYGVIDFMERTAKLTECHTIPEMCAMEICELKDGPSNQIHVLLSGLAHVYHSFIEDSNASPLGSYPMPIGNSKGKASFIKSDRDFVEFYVPMPAASGVVQTCKMSDGSYTKRECHIITGDADIVMTPCYSTEMEFTDSEGAPLSDISVNIWALDNMYVECDNGTHRIGPKNKLRLTTNCFGKITIVQHTDSISGSTICCYAPDYMTREQVIYLNQHEVVMERLQGLSASELVSAKKNDDEWLLPDKYRNLAEAEKIVSSIQTMLSAVAAIRPRDVGYVGAYLGDTNSRFADIKGIENGFILSHSADGSLAKQSITSDEFRARLDNSLSRGYTSIITNLGDVCQSISDNCITADSISACGNQVAFDLSISSNKYTYVGTLTDEYQILDSIGSIFSKAGVSFNGFFSWVGFIFDWKDFVRMKQGIDYVFIKTQSFMSSFMSEMKSEADAYLDDMKVRGRTELKNLKDWAEGKSLFSKVESDYPEDNALSQENSNNFVLQKTLKYCATNKIQFPESILECIEASGDLYDAISKYCNDINTKQEFKDLSSFMSGRYKTSANVRGVLFSDFIGALDKATSILFEGLKDIAHFACDSIASVFTSLNALISAELNIPIVSRLYKKKTGKVLCLRDIISLLGAIISTITYKFIYSSSPIGSDAELEEFKNYIDNRLGGIGYAESSNETIDKLENVFQIIALGCSTIAGVVEAVDEAMDSLESGPLMNGNKTDLGALSIIIFGCEIISLGFSFPTLFKDSEKWDYVFYAYDVIVLAVDYRISLHEVRYLTKTTTGVIETICFAVLRLVLLAIAYFLDGYRKTIDIWLIIVNSVGEICKFLMLIKHPTAKAILMLINGICVLANIGLVIANVLSADAKTEKKATI